MAPRDANPPSRDDPALEEDDETISLEDIINALPSRAQQVQFIMDVLSNGLAAMFDELGSAFHGACA